MTEISLPWSGTVTGDAGAYSDDNWQDAWKDLFHAAVERTGRADVGPLLSSGDAPDIGLQVQATGPASAAVDVLRGSAIVEGTYYRSTATETQSISANASGNDRIDTIALEKDDLAQTVRQVVVVGTPAATPSPPTLTQIPGTTYQIPIADVYAANGFATITDANITPRQEWANAADGVYLKDIQNNSGATLETGDAVIWDSANDRSVITTTTIDDSNLAGAWVGLTQDGDFGRVLVRGVGFVKTTAAVTRGEGLVTHSVAREAQGRAGAGSIGLALETVAVAGLVLAYIDIKPRIGAFARYTNEIASGGAGPVYTSGADRTVILNTEVVDADGLGALAANQVTLIAGSYDVFGELDFEGNSGASSRLRLKIFDVTGATELVKGKNSHLASNAAGTGAIVQGRFTIDVDSIIELRVRTNNSTTGPQATSDGTNEIYSVLEFKRIAHG